MRTRLLMAGGGSGGFRPPYNDEFDGYSPMAWTLDGTFPPDINSSVPGKIYMPVGSTAHRALIPPMPFTVTAFMSSVTVTDLHTSYGNATLGIAEASPGGQPGPLWWGTEMPDIDFLDKTARYDGRFANFAAEPTHLGTKIEAVGHVYDVPTYHRIVVHSATNMDILYSTDNVTYSTYGTGFNPTLTPGAIILVSFGMTTEWDWVRFT